MSSEPVLSPKAIEELRTARSRVANASWAERLWERHLTPEDRQRLGDDLSHAYGRHGTIGMWIVLRGVSQLRAIVDLAQLLGFLRAEDHSWLLREIGEAADVDEAMDRAIVSGDLVLAERPRSVFWNGIEIEIDWHRQAASWEFIWELCRNSKAGQPIDTFSFGQSGDRNIVTKRKSRLSKLPDFPIDLIDKMETMGRGPQQLTLSPERIRIFELSGVDTLREWTP